MEIEANFNMAAGSGGRKIPANMEVILVLSSVLRYDQMLDFIRHTGCPVPEDTRSQRPQKCFKNKGATMDTFVFYHERD